MANGRIRAKSKRSAYRVETPVEVTLDYKQLALELAGVLGKKAPALALDIIVPRLLPSLMRGLKRPDDLEIAWRLHLLPVLGKETAETLDRIKAEEALDGINGSARTFNKTRWAGGRLLEAARNEGMWEGKNVFRLVKPRKTEKRSPRIYQPAEFLRILQASRDVRVALWATAYFTGARKSELRRWERDDLDLVLARFGHRKTKNGTDRVGLPLNDQLIPILEAHLASHDSKWVFPAPSGKQMGASTHLEVEFRATLARAGFVEGYDHRCRRCGHSERHQDCEPRRCDACGMKLWPRAMPVRAKFHDLRHMTASLLQDRGVPRSVVKRLIGHKSGDITDLYTHHSEAYMREMVNRLRLPLDGGEPEPEGNDSNGGPSSSGALRTSNPKAAGSIPAGRKALSQSQSLLTAGEVADALRVCRDTIYRLVARGLLPVVRVGARFRFRPDDVEAFLRGPA